MELTTLQVDRAVQVDQDGKTVVGVHVTARVFVPGAHQVEEDDIVAIRELFNEMQERLYPRETPKEKPRRRTRLRDRKKKPTPKLKQRKSII